ncbi:MAG: AraC family transcriptional regulator [Pseudomonadota bacterium]
MPIPPEFILRDKFEQDGAELQALQVSSDRSLFVYDAFYPEHEGRVRDIPALFAMMCVSGGGHMLQRTSMQHLEGTVEPGDIGIAAPRSPGFGRWPEMRVIGFGIEIQALTDSFGKSWPRNLRQDFISKLFRDPMVEATMMQVGYTHGCRVSDSVLLHAAHMIVHQLLDAPSEPVAEAEEADTHPLTISTTDAIRDYVLEHIERTISVDELAREIGISRHHFSRRFRAATGKSPYQYILDLKLDQAADQMERDRRIKVIDVANMVGYRNPAQFSQAFRRRFGQTPRRWRLRRN